VLLSGVQWQLIPAGLLTPDLIAPADHKHIPATSMFITALSTFLHYASADIIPIVAGLIQTSRLTLAMCWHWWHTIISSNTDTWYWCQSP
jgi:hypothetical protein